jgi:hypothetical protein
VADAADESVQEFADSDQALEAELSKALRTQPIIPGVRFIPISNMDGPMIFPPISMQTIRMSKE